MGFVKAEANRSGLSLHMTALNFDSQCQVLDNPTTNAHEREKRCTSCVSLSRWLEYFHIFVICTKCPGLLLVLVFSIVEKSNEWIS